MSVVIARTFPSGTADVRLRFAPGSWRRGHRFPPSSFRHAASISGDQSSPSSSRMVVGDHAEKFAEQFARRAVGVVRLHLAFDHAKMSRAVAGKIQHRIDGQRQHRALDEFAALAAEHRLGFRVFAEQAVDRPAASDPRNAPRRVQSCAGSDWPVPSCAASRFSCVSRSFQTSRKRISKKKSRARSPALKIVSTLFPRKIGFDLD